MTVYPNLNLIDGTKDFSGRWENSNKWENDGTYKGLTVKKTTEQWAGIHKTFKVPENGTYTFSVYVKSSGNKADILGYLNINGKYESQLIPDTPPKNDFDWALKSFSVDLKAGDIVNAGYYISGSGTLWAAGHKWEHGSTATPWMPSFSEATASDYPSYIGTYTDNNSNEQSTDPEKYTWKKIVE
ncbi:major tail extension protein [Lactococcus phage 62601]|uniref:Major tail extension protein n=1 Tax=Lactococcus phage 62601 TaxID=2029668 RepID=A0A343JPX5_9CAUD|nr:tail protein [Lactococcus phage 62601]ASZ71548.1 major tail extension protein [Lactococcus phage 62601]